MQKIIIFFLIIPLIAIISIPFLNDTSQEIDMLYSISKYLIISILVIAISFNAAVNYAGIDRTKNADVFPKLIPALLVIFSVQLIGQILVLIGILYFFFSLLFNMIPTGLIFGFALGGVFGVFALLKALYQLFKKERYPVFGKYITKNDYKDLWEHVYQIADKVGSERPDNIIIGLDPNFFVTAVKVKTYDGKYEGKTLYLSLPLMNLLTMNELDSIIGHELGHFKGDDTDYSIKFSPVYKGLSTAVAELERQENIILLPFEMMLSEMYEILDVKQASISRSRELVADEIGVSVSSPESFTIALTKIIIFSSFWEYVVKENTARLFKNKVSPNLSSVFLDAVKYNLSKKDIEEIKNSALSSSISHPTDTHPILSERVNNIGYDYSKLNMKSIQNIGNSAKILLTDYENLELDISNSYQEYAMYEISLYKEESKEPAWGQKNDGSDSDVSDVNEEVDDVVNILYVMAAAMVGADGKIEQEEISIAEDIGAELHEDFDRVDFRVYVNNLDKIPDFKEAAEASKVLESQPKKMIYNYLFDIANADGEFHDTEKKLLDELSNIWGLS